MKLKKDVRPDLIHEIIDDYAAVYPNLSENDTSFPKPAYLHSIVSQGDTLRTVDAIRPGNSSPGSERIVEIVEKSARPVNITIWGGARDVAQALCDLRERHSSAELGMLLDKMRVYAIADQDGFNQMVNGKRVDVVRTGRWIKENFPQLLYIETGPPERNRFAVAFRGMYQNDSVGGGFAMTPLVSEGVEKLNTEPWLKENILTGHGSLGGRVSSRSSKSSQFAKYKRRQGRGYAIMVLLSSHRSWRSGAS